MVSAEYYNVVGCHLGFCAVLTELCLEEERKSCAVEAGVLCKGIAPHSEYRRPCQGKPPSIGWGKSSPVIKYSSTVGREDQIDRCASERLEITR